MDEEDRERKRKLEAGKARLAQFRQRKGQTDNQASAKKTKKKKSSSGSKHREQPEETPEAGSPQSDDVSSQPAPSGASTTAEFTIMRTLPHGEIIKHDKTYTIEPESEVSTTADDYSSEVIGDDLQMTAHSSAPWEEEFEVRETLCERGTQSALSRLEVMEDELVGKQQEIEELNRELEEMRAAYGTEGLQQLQEFETAIKQRDEIITQLTTNLQQARKEKDDIMREFLELTEQSHKLKIQFQHLQAGETLRNSSHSSTATDLLHSKQQIITYQLQLEERDHRLSLCQKEIEEFCAQVTSLQEQIHDQQVQRKELESSSEQKLEEKDLLLNGLKSAVHNEEIKSLELKERITEAEKSIAELRAQLTQKSQEISSLTEELHSSRQKERRSSDEIKQLMGSVEELQKRHHRDSQSEADLVQRMESETQRRLERLQAELDEAHGRQIVQMKQELLAQHALEIDGLLAQHRQEVSQAAIGASTQHINELNAAVNALNARLQQTDEQRDKMKEDFSHRLQAVSKEKSQLQMQIEDLLQDLGYAREQVRKARESLNEKENKLNEASGLFVTVDGLRAKLAAADEFTKELEAKHEAEVTNYKIKLEMLEREKDAVLDRMAESQEGELEKLRTHFLFSQEEELVKLKEDLTREHRTNIENLKDNLDVQYKQQMDRMTHDMGQTITAMQSERDSLITKQNYLMLEISNLKDLLQSVNDPDSERTMTQINELQKELECFRKEGKEKGTMEQEVQALQLRVETLEEEVKEKDTLKQKAASLEANNKLLKDQYDALLDSLKERSVDHCENPTDSSTASHALDLTYSSASSHVLDPTDFSTASHALDPTDSSATSNVLDPTDSSATFHALDLKIERLTSENAHLRNQERQLREEIERQKNTFSFAEKNFEVNYGELKEEYSCLAKLKEQVEDGKAQLEVEYKTKLDALNNELVELKRGPRKDAAQLVASGSSNLVTADRSEVGEVIEKDSTELMEKLEIAQRDKQELSLKLSTLSEELHIKDNEISRLKERVKGLCVERDTTKIEEVLLELGSDHIQRGGQAPIGHPTKGGLVVSNEASPSLEGLMEETVRPTKVHSPLSPQTCGSYGESVDVLMERESFLQRLDELTRKLEEESSILGRTRLENEELQQKLDRVLQEQADTELQMEAQRISLHHIHTAQLELISENFQSQKKSKLCDLRQTKETHNLQEQHQGALERLQPQHTGCEESSCRDLTQRLMKRICQECGDIIQVLLSEEAEKKNKSEPERREDEMTSSTSLSQHRTAVQTLQNNLSRLLEKVLEEYRQVTDISGYIGETADLRESREQPDIAQVKQIIITSQDPSTDQSGVQEWPTLPPAERAEKLKAEISQQRAQLEEKHCQEIQRLRSYFQQQLREKEERFSKEIHHLQDISNLQLRDVSEEEVAADLGIEEEIIFRSVSHSFADSLKQVDAAVQMGDSSLSASIGPIYQELQSLRQALFSKYVEEVGALTKHHKAELEQQRADLTEKFSVEKAALRQEIIQLTRAKQEIVNGGFQPSLCPIAEEKSDADLNQLLEERYQEKIEQEIARVIVEMSIGFAQQSELARLSSLEDAEQQNLSQIHTETPEKDMDYQTWDEQAVELEQQDGTKLQESPVTDTADVDLTVQPHEHLSLGQEHSKAGPETWPKEKPKEEEENPIAAMGAEATKYKQMYEERVEEMRHELVRQEQEYQQAAEALRLAHTAQLERQMYDQEQLLAEVHRLRAQLAESRSERSGERLPDTGTFMSGCGVCGGDGGEDMVTLRPAGERVADTGTVMSGCGACGGDGGEDTAALRPAGERLADTGTFMSGCGACGGDGGEHTSALRPAGERVADTGTVMSGCGACGGDGGEDTAALRPAGERFTDTGTVMTGCGACGGEGGGGGDMVALHPAVERVADTGTVMTGCGACGGDGGEDAVVLHPAGERLPDTGTVMSGCGVCGGDGGEDMVTLRPAGERLPDTGTVMSGCGGDGGEDTVALRPAGERVTGTEEAVTEPEKRGEKEAECGRGEGEKGLEEGRSITEDPGGERKSLKRVNKRLLKILLEIAKTTGAAEETIGRHVVGLLDKSGRRPSKGVTWSPEQGDLQAASAGVTTATAADGTEVCSEVKDQLLWSEAPEEDLDVPLQLAEADFLGTGIGPEEEAQVLNIGGRLQSALEKLLQAINETSNQLEHAKAAQTELVRESLKRKQETTDLLRCQEELQERLSEEAKAREHLALELSKAEGLLDGYTDERVFLEKQMQEKSDLIRHLEQELQSTGNRLQELEQERQQMQEEKELLSRQKLALKAGAAPAEQRLVEAAAVAAPKEELLEETEKLLKEKIEVQRQAEKDSGDLHKQVKVLEVELEEQVSRNLEIEQEKNSVLEDLRQKNLSLEKQLEKTRRFLDEQAVDREHERDVFQQEIQKLEQQLKMPQRHQPVNEQQSNEVEKLEGHLKEKTDKCSELLLSKEQLQRDVQERNEEIEKLECRIRELEQALLISADTLQKVEDRRPSLAAAKAEMPLEAQLQVEREAIDRKEKEITNLVEQLEQFREELENKNEEVQQLHMQLEIQRKESATRLQELGQEIKVLKDELEMVHPEETSSSAGANCTQGKMDDLLLSKNQEISLLNEQINKLQAQLEVIEEKNEQIKQYKSQMKCLKSDQERLKNNSEEEIEKLNEVIEKLQEELSYIEQKATVSFTSMAEITGGTTYQPADTPPLAGHADVNVDNMVSDRKEGEREEQVPTTSSEVTQNSLLDMESSLQQLQTAIKEKDLNLKQYFEQVMTLNEETKLLSETVEKLKIELAEKDQKIEDIDISKNLPGSICSETSPLGKTEETSMNSELEATKAELKQVKEELEQLSTSAGNTIVDELTIVRSKEESDINYTASIQNLTDALREKTAQHLAVEALLASVQETSQNTLDNLQYQVQDLQKTVQEKESQLQELANKAPLLENQQVQEIANIAPLHENQEIQELANNAKLLQNQEVQELANNAKLLQNQEVQELANNAMLLENQEVQELANNAKLIENQEVQELNEFIRKLKLDLIKVEEKMSEESKNTTDGESQRTHIESAISDSASLQRRVESDEEKALLSKEVEDAKKELTLLKEELKLLRQSQKLSAVTEGDGSREDSISHSDLDVNIPKSSAPEKTGQAVAGQSAETEKTGQALAGLSAETEKTVQAVAGQSLATETKKTTQTVEVQMESQLHELEEVLKMKDLQLLQYVNQKDLLHDQEQKIEQLNEEIRRLRQDLTEASSDLKANATTRSKETLENEDSNEPNQAKVELEMAQKQEDETVKSASAQVDVTKAALTMTGLEQALKAKAAELLESQKSNVSLEETTQAAIHKMELQLQELQKIIEQKDLQLMGYVQQKDIHHQQNQEVEQLNEAKKLQQELAQSDPHVHSREAAVHSESILSPKTELKREELMQTKAELEKTKTELALLKDELSKVNLTVKHDNVSDGNTSVGGEGVPTLTDLEQALTEKAAQLLESQKLNISLEETTQAAILKMELQLQELQKVIEQKDLELQQYIQQKDLYSQQIKEVEQLNEVVRKLQEELSQSGPEVHSREAVEGSENILSHQTQLEREELMQAKAELEEAKTELAILKEELSKVNSADKHDNMSDGNTSVEGEALLTVTDLQQTLKEKTALLIESQKLNISLEETTLAAIHKMELQLQELQKVIEQKDLELQQYVQQKDLHHQQIQEVEQLNEVVRKLQEELAQSGPDVHSREAVEGSENILSHQTELDREELMQAKAELEKAKMELAALKEELSKVHLAEKHDNVSDGNTSIEGEAALTVTDLEQALREKEAELLASQAMLVSLDETTQATIHSLESTLQELQKDFQLKDSELLQYVNQKDLIDQQTKEIERLSNVISMNKQNSEDAGPDFGLDGERFKEAHQENKVLLQNEARLEDSELVQTKAELERTKTELAAKMEEITKMKLSRKHEDLPDGNTPRDEDVGDTTQKVTNLEQALREKTADLLASQTLLTSLEETSQATVHNVESQLQELRKAVQLKDSELLHHLNQQNILNQQTKEIEHLNGVIDSLQKQLAEASRRTSSSAVQEGKSKKLEKEMTEQMNGGEMTFIRTLDSKAEKEYEEPFEELYSNEERIHGKRMSDGDVTAVMENKDQCDWMIEALRDQNTQLLANQSLFTSVQETMQSSIDSLENRLEELQKVIKEKDMEILLHLEEMETLKEQVRVKTDEHDQIMLTMEDSLREKVAAALVSEAKLKAIQLHTKCMHAEDGSPALVEESKILQSHGPNLAQQGESSILHLQLLELEKQLSDLHQQLQIERDQVILTNQLAAEKEKQLLELQKLLKNAKGQKSITWAATEMSQGDPEPSNENTNPILEHQLQTLAEEAIATKEELCHYREVAEKLREELMMKESSLVHLEEDLREVRKCLSNAEEKLAFYMKREIQEEELQMSDMELPQVRSPDWTGLDRTTSSSQTDRISNVNNGNQTPHVPRKHVGVQNEPEAGPPSSSSDEVADLMEQYTEKISQMQELHAAEILDMESRHISEAESLRREQYTVVQALTDECDALKAVIEALKSGGGGVPDSALSTSYHFTDAASSDVGTECDWSQGTYDQIPEELRGDEEDIHTELIPSKIKDLLRAVHQEGMQVLSLTEATSPEKEPLVPVKTQPWRDERKAMLETIASLKELIAKMKIHKDSEAHTRPGFQDLSPDWRGELLRAIQEVFQREQDVLMSAFHAQLAPLAKCDANALLNQIQHKLQEQGMEQINAMDCIQNADRRSLLLEIQDLRAQLTSLHSDPAIQSLFHPNPEAGGALYIQQEQASHSQELHMQLRSLQSKAGELQEQLGSERLLAAEIKNELALTKMELESNLQLQHKHFKELETLRVELKKKREELDSLNEALGNEQKKCRELQYTLEKEQTKGKLKDLRENEDLEDLQMLVDEQKAKALEISQQLEEEKKLVKDLRDGIELAERAHDAAMSQERSRVLELPVFLDAEKARSAEISNALECRQELQAHVQNTESDGQSGGQNSDLLKELQSQLDSRHARIVDLVSEVESYRLECVQLRLSLEEERLSLNKELEAEQEVSRLAVTQAKELSHTLEELQRQEQERVTELRRQEQERVTELRRHQTEEAQLRETIQRLQNNAQDIKNSHSGTREPQQSHIEVRSSPDLVSSTAQPQTGSPPNLLCPDPLSVVGEDLGTEGAPLGIDVIKQRLQQVAAKLRHLAAKSIQRELFGKADDEDLAWSQNRIQEVLSQLERMAMLSLQGENLVLPSGISANTLTEKLLTQNAELTGYVSRLTEEKKDLQNSLLRLEGEVSRYRARRSPADHSAADNSLNTDNLLVTEREAWSREKLSLHKSLKQTEAELSKVRAELRNEIMQRDFGRDTDNMSLKRVYGKYLRSESFRKALIYQKKYLLLLLGGFQECEDATLALIARMGGQPTYTDLQVITNHSRAFTRFRSAVRVTIAIFRMRFLVRRWHRATISTTSGANRNSCGQGNEVRTDCHPARSLERNSSCRSQSGFNSPQSTVNSQHRYISASDVSPCFHLQHYDPDRALTDYISRLEALQKRLGSVPSGSGANTTPYGIRR
ncbi:A-kinase anchor protein 9 [Mantella aurantiaca]